MQNGRDACALLFIQYEYINSYLYIVRSFTPHLNSPGLAEAMTSSIGLFRIAVQCHLFHRRRQRNLQKPIQRICCLGVM